MPAIPRIRVANFVVSYSFSSLMILIIHSVSSVNKIVHLDRIKTIVYNKQGI